MGLPTASSARHLSSRYRANSGTGTSVKKAANQIITLTNHNHKYVKYDHISAKNFAYLPEAKVIFSCGHWDWSVRITSIESGKLLQSLTGHNDVVNCLALAKDYGNRWLVTGSRDCTLITWDIHLDRNNSITITPIRTLYGHDDSINCIVVNPEIDMIVSGSDDGTMIVHNLRDGKYIRSILNIEGPKKYDHDFNGDGNTEAINTATSGNSTTLASNSSNTTLIQTTPKQASALSILYPNVSNDEDNMSAIHTPATISTTPLHSSTTFFSRSPPPTLEFPAVAGASTGTTSLPTPKASGRITGWKVTWLGISREGYIVTYSAEQQRLTTFSLNGDFICSKKLSESLYTFLLSEDGMVLLTGGSSCLIVFRWVSYLPLLFFLPSFHRFFLRFIT